MTLWHRIFFHIKVVSISKHLDMETILHIGDHSTSQSVLVITLTPLNSNTALYHCALPLHCAVTVPFTSTTFTFNFTFTFTLTFTFPFTVTFTELSYSGNSYNIYYGCKSVMFKYIFVHILLNWLKYTQEGQLPTNYIKGTLNKQCCLKLWNALNTCLFDQINWLV